MQTSTVRGTVNNYAGVGVDAAYLTPPGAIIPNAATRSGSGDVVGWNFDISGPNVLAPNRTSVPLVLRTNSQNFAINTASVIDGATASVNGLGPAAGILPEPA